MKRRILFAIIVLCLWAAPAMAGSLMMLGGSRDAVADVTAPELNTVTVNATSWTFAYSEAVTCSPTSDCCDAYNAVFTTAGTVTLTYSSGSGTASVVCTGSPTVANGDTASDLDYTQPGNGIEDAAGNDLATFTNQQAKVTNETPAACATQQTPAVTTLIVTNSNIGDFSSRIWQATKFVYSGTTDKGICKIDVHGLETGDVGAKTMTIEIRGHDATDDDPNDTVYSTGTFAANLFPASADWVNGTTLTVNTNLTNGNTYWIIMGISGSPDTSNYVIWSADNTATTERVDRDGDATGTWTNDFTDRSLMYRIYSQ